MKKVTKLLTLSIIFVIGFTIGFMTTNRTTQNNITSKTNNKIADYQVTNDGECQVNFGDGTSETIFIDMPQPQTIVKEVKTVETIEVPKIVEKVVEVPKVVEKVVEVPKIVEKVVEVEAPTKSPMGDEKINSIKNIEELDGDTIINFTDGSYALYNENNQEYIFQHYELGDWDLELKSAKELEMVIKTFLNE